ncbi:MAG: hypothetical protein HQM09_23070 [Candidatus Riflebacteria bacterium]|nr:hypothetical protein [Candidatus Riflebacteria bacterium]
MRNAAFTFIEMVIACSVLTLFLCAAFLLLRGGEKHGGQALWLQKTLGSMRTIVRHMSEHARRASPPSTIVFAKNIVENTSDDFRSRVSGRERLAATESASVGYDECPATRLLLFIEATPERFGGPNPCTASISYNVYSLSREGRLLYHRFEESVPQTAPPEYIGTLRHPVIPPPEARLVESHSFMENVESVETMVSSQSSGVHTIAITITCVQPGSITRRTEKVSLVPNSAVIVVSPSQSGW